MRKKQEAKHANKKNMETAAAGRADRMRHICDNWLRTGD